MELFLQRGDDVVCLTPMSDHVVTSFARPAEVGHGVERFVADDARGLDRQPWSDSAASASELVALVRGYLDRGYRIALCREHRWPRDAASVMDALGDSIEVLVLNGPSSLDPLRHLGRLRCLVLVGQPFPTASAGLALPTVHELEVRGLHHETDLLDLDALLQPFPQLRSLTLDHCRTPSLQPIDRLRHLHTLRLRLRPHEGPPVTPTQLTRLHQLELDAGAIDDLAQLAAHPQLEALTLWGVVHPASLAALRACPKLRTLDVHTDPPLEPADLAPLLSLTDLRIHYRGEETAVAELHAQLGRTRPDPPDLTRPAWLLELDDVDPDGGDRLGSHLFCRPYLLPGEPWPPCGSCGEPMVPVLQLDLATLPDRPRTGLLQFFWCDAVQRACQLEQTKGRSNAAMLLRIVQPSAPSSDVDALVLPIQPQPYAIVGFSEQLDAPYAVDVSQLYGLTDDTYGFDQPLEGHKIGGWPTPRRVGHWPRCPTCDEPMRHLVQLDPLELGWSAGGHIFACGTHPDTLAFRQ